MVEHISDSVRSKTNKLLELSLLVEDFELATSDSKPQSLYLHLIQKAHPPPEAVEACEDGNFLFEIPKQKLIRLACDILHTLDPVPPEQLLEKIRVLLKDQG